MSNKSVSLKFFETYGDRHDVEGCVPLFAEDATIYSTAAPDPGPMDIQGYKQLGHAMLGGFPDVKVNIVEQLEAGNKVVSRVVWSGTHTGPLNGLPPTGRSFHSEAVFIDTFEHGKIRERREVSDMLGMMQQLGLIPPPTR